MPRHQCWSSYLVLAACALTAALSLGSFAAATDTTITDGALILQHSSPPQTWEIFGNDVSLQVYNASSNSRPFTIVVGALSGSLFVGYNGKVGLGTDPDTNFHISTTDLLPTLRLESTSVAAPYVWDLEASADQFNLIDASSGTTPFGVRAGAPSNSLFVDSVGNVGFGLTSPAAPIHVKKLAQSGIAETIANFEISDDSIGRLDIGNVSTGNGIFHPRLRGTTASQAVALTMEGLITTDAGLNPVVAYDAALRAGGAVVTRPLVVYRNNGTNKVTIAANGNVTATSFITASSRALKDKIAELSSDTASAALRQLTPVQFVYKDDASAEPRVGFIAEDVPDLIAEPDRASVPVMDVVAVVTRVVKDQDRLNEQQQKTIDRLQQANDRQQKLIAELAQRLANLEQKFGK